MKSWMKLAFCEVLDDYTSRCRKIPKEEYLSNGKYIVIDQGQNNIAGYTNIDDGLFEDVPAIVFGDHTRIIKYVDEPFFLGADGVKLLKSKIKDANYKYLYYVLRNARIPDTGYNRHFKWLKEINLEYKDAESQKNIVKTLDTVTNIIELYKVELSKLDNLIRARFVEMFGDPSLNNKGYPIRSLPEIAEYWNGLTYRPEDISDDGTVVLRSGNIQNTQLDFEDIVRVKCSIGDKKYVKENDILMCSRNGSARLVGKVALIKSLKEPMSFGAFMMNIRSRYYPYLMVYFQMPIFRAQITMGATTTINQITVKMLDNIKLPVPEKGDIEIFATFVHQVNKSKLLSVSQPQIHIYKTLTLL